MELLHRPYPNTGGAATLRDVPAPLLVFNYGDALLRYDPKHPYTKALMAAAIDGPPFRLASGVM